jgi:putative ribosome biogenesis GTPase RsgA
VATTGANEPFASFTGLRVDKNGTPRGTWQQQQQHNTNTITITKPYAGERRTMEKEYDAIFKLVLLGESGVGKSSLMDRFTKGLFDPANKATIGKKNRTKESGPSQ